MIDSITIQADKEAYLPLYKTDYWLDNKQIKLDSYDYGELDVKEQFELILNIINKEFPGCSLEDISIMPISEDTSGCTCCTEYEAYLLIEGPNLEDQTNNEKKID